MKKKEIVEAIYQNSEYKKSDIQDIVDMVFNIMGNAMADEDKIMISNFGTFEKIYQDEYNSLLVFSKVFERFYLQNLCSRFLKLLFPLHLFSI